MDKRLDQDNGPVSINNDLERKIADAFDVFDHAADKTVDVHEVGTILRSLGSCPSEAEIQEILVAVEDHGNPGSVHLSKFLPYVSQLYTEHKLQPAPPEKLLQAFHLLDPERRGFLTLEHITALMTQDGEPFTQEELDEMLEIAIDPHTKTVPYEYYINQLMHEPAEENDTYKLADRVESEKPPPPPGPKRISQMLQNLQGPAD